MKIYNGERIIKNKQLIKFIDFLKLNVTPKEIIIYEKRIDILRYLNKSILFILDIIILFEVLFGKIEGMYLRRFDKVFIFIFSQNDDDNNLHSKQLYSLHALTHEMRHVWQAQNKYEINEEDADNFATNFINNNSRKIKEIMKWKREWEVEEE